ncbi:MAG TPA: lipid-binding SYLF domain-containing protein [Geobacteraceae bacterium]|nr:lipid-binding SYLF domain-containing protein [Geobacteraceae bacterium]
MKQHMKRFFRHGMQFLVGAFVAAALIGASTAVYAASKEEAQALIDKSKGALSDMLSDSAFSWLHSYLKTCNGVLIFPQVLKAGFFLGGSGGSGVLLVHDEKTGEWSQPAFYTLGSVTFGLQIGGEAAEVIMVAMNSKAIDSLLSSSVKLGGDVSVTIGPVGGGAKGAVTVPEVTADFVSFTKTKGIYAGLNLEGSVLQVRDGLNGAYYGREVMPKDILIRKEVGNSDANELRSALHKASAR